MCPVVTQVFNQRLKAIPVYPCSLLFDLIPAKKWVMRHFLLTFDVPRIRTRIKARKTGEMENKIIE